MSILKFPNNTAMPDKTSCALCARRISLEEATIGPISADGGVTLMCSGHLWDGLNFIDRLADYMAEEREKYFRANGNNVMRFGGGGQDAWFVY
jgi:hypothetical protein